MTISTTGYRANWALGAGAFGYGLAMVALVPIPIAFPSMAEYFGVEVSHVGWAASSYLLGLTVLALLAGRLGDLYGHRRVFVGGVVATTVCALVSSVAPVWPVLIAARGVQGVGAALVAGNAMAIVANAFDERQRGRAIGTLTTATSLGLLGATYLCSLLLPMLSWRVVFLVTVPVGLAALACSVRMGPGRRPANMPRLDLVGAGLLTLTLASVILLFNHFHDGAETFEAGWRYHSSMQALTVFSLVLFLWWERRTAHPLIDLRVFRNASFSFASLANVAFHMTMMATSYMFPFVVEKGFGLAAAATATILMGNNLAATFGSLGAGYLLDRTRSRLLQAGAMSLTGSSLLFMAVIPDLTYAAVIVAGLGLGLSGGMFMTTNNAFVLTCLPPERRGLASGMLELTRQYGHTLGITVTSLVVGEVLVGTQGGTSFTPIFQHSMVFASATAFVGMSLSFMASIWRRPSAVALQVRTEPVEAFTV